MTETPMIKFWREKCEAADAAGTERPNFGQARELWHDHLEGLRRKREANLRQALLAAAPKGEQP